MTKRERELADARYNLRVLERQVRDMGKALDEAVKSLKWARDTLVEKEAENRKLKLIIMQLTVDTEVD